MKLRVIQAAKEIKVNLDDWSKVGFLPTEKLLIVKISPFSMPIDRLEIYKVAETYFRLNFKLPISGTL